LKILNLIGIEPRVLANERCCGHDPYWQGDMDTFQKLAKLNLELLTESGAKKLITTCPECAHTLKYTYPEQIGETGLEIMHLSELLAGERSLVDKTQNNGLETVTYQDPCRLGRYLGIYQEPRELIEDLGYQLVEMRHHSHSSICCGTSCWTNCGQMNKRTQADRLLEARSTGAQRLVTACVKCQIHLKCAQNDPLHREELQLEIQDLTTLIADRL
jgi:Fe-S oxidoreductase